MLYCSISHLRMRISVEKQSIALYKADNCFLTRIHRKWHFKNGSAEYGLVSHDEVIPKIVPSESL